MRSTNDDDLNFARGALLGKVDRFCYISDMLVFSLQCSDTIGWVTERHPTCNKLGVGLFVGWW